MLAYDIDAATEDRSVFAFYPNAARALRIEAEVRAGFADSIAAALAAIAEYGAPDGSDLVARIRSGPVSPVVAGAYTELVEAIFADDVDAAIAIAHDLCSPNFGSHTGLRIVTLSDADLGPGQAARYRRLIDDNSKLQLQVRAYAPEAFATVSGFVSDGAALLEAAMPELAGEMRALVREIVLVDKPGNRHFGASSFQIWGALFLKPYPHGNRAAIVEQLAHETSHALLFGLSKGKPLVRNEPDEVYPSPIRQDLRPMDGVVHATYVIARMHYAMSQLLQSGLLTSEEAEVARATRDAHRAHYQNGLAVVETNAKWTEVGEAAHSAARVYMAAADDA